MRSNLKRFITTAIVIPIALVSIILQWYLWSFMASEQEADGKAFLRSYSQVAASYFENSLNMNSETVINISALIMEELQNGTDPGESIKSILTDESISAAWFFLGVSETAEGSNGVLMYSQKDDYNILHTFEENLDSHNIAREMDLLSAKTYTSISIELTYSPALASDTQVFRINAPIYKDGAIIGLCGAEFPINQLIRDFKLLYPDVVSRIAIAYSMTGNNENNVYLPIHPLYGDTGLFVEVELLNGDLGFNLIDIRPIIAALIVSELLIILVAILVIRRALTPLGEIVSSLEELANGNFSCRIPDMRSENTEYNFLANSTSKIKSYLTESRMVDISAKKLNLQYTKLMGYIQSAFDEDSSFEDLAERLVDILGYRKATIITRKGNKINILAVSNLAASSEDAQDLSIYSLSYSRLFYLIKDKDILTSSKFALSKLYNDFLGSDTVSICVLPLKVKKGELFGYILLESSQFMSIDQDTETLLTNMAKALSGITVRKLSDSSKKYPKNIQQIDPDHHERIVKIEEEKESVAETKPVRKKVDTIKKASVRTNFDFIYAPKAKILIVDDTKLNLTVAYEILKLCGIEGDEAESGARALAMIKKRNYDIVFMDHMMPGMDGIETTQAIRALGSPYDKLTIIALTANAVKGAKEMLIEGGLNDFISKPIDKKLLNDLLSKWLPKELIEIRPSLDKEAEAVDYSEMLNKLSKCPYINVKLGLNIIAGNQELYVKTLKIVVSTMPEGLNKLKRLLSKDLYQYAIEVHGLKGSLASIGATALASAAEALELSAKDGDMGYCAANNSAFIERAIGLNNAILDAIGELKKDAPIAQGDLGELMAALEEAKKAVADFDLEGVSALLSKHFNKRFNQGRIDRLLIELKASIESYNYDLAEKTIAEILTI